VALWRLEERADIVAPLLTDVQVDAILARGGGGGVNRSGRTRDGRERPLARRRSRPQR